MSEPVPITAPIVEVTLLEDRAHVVRRGRAVLPVGLSTVVIEDTAPAISDKTLNASIAVEGAKVLNVRAKRSMRILESDKRDDLQKLHQRIDEITHELKRSEAQIEMLNHEQNLIDEVISQTLKEFAEDAAWGRQTEDTWNAQLQELTAREQGLRDSVLELHQRNEKPNNELADLRTQLANAQDPASIKQCRIEATLQIAVAGEYQIQFDYIVPGACWRPCHTAKLSLTPRPSVLFECDGCVWQNTGEAWDNVTLYFSTQRSSLGAEPPKLSSDILNVQRKQQVVVVETREQEIFTAGLGSTQAQKAQELPGIDDGGETLNLKAGHPASVPSNGRPYRVNIFSFESACQAEYVLMPELSRCVFLKTILANYATSPILAGPVDLIRDSGLAGRTSLLYIAPGEQIPLGWGPDSAVRVSREHTELDPETSMLGSWVSKEHRIAIHVSNLGREDRTIQVTERIPISELEKVQIAADAPNTSNSAAPDANGFVHWTVALKPHGRQSLKLRYTMKKHKDVVEAL